jgi:hypothetical protein
LHRALDRKRVRAPAYRLSGKRLKDEFNRRYSRGKITVLDRAKQEKLCCECYAVVKRETDRLLPPLPPAHGVARTGGV